MQLSEIQSVYVQNHSCKDDKWTFSLTVLSAEGEEDDLEYTFKAKLDEYGGIVPLPESGDDKKVLAMIDDFYASKCEEHLYRY